jgi:tetratricopeptide (TPR) repeat protein
VATARDYHGLTVSLIGAPERVPIQRIRRELERRGAVLMRRIVYDTQITVIAHGASGRLATGSLDGVLARAGLRSRLLTEHQFLRELGLLDALPEKRREYERAAFSRLCRLSPKEQMWLELFDVIEPIEGFFDFPDVVLARQVRSLLDAGLALPAIIGAVIAFRHAAARDAFGQIGNLVQLPSGEIVVRMGAWLAEMDGQLRLPIEDRAPPAAGELYDMAEAAEQVGDWEGAERLYRRCIQADPNDALSHYNCANALRHQNRAQEAAILFARATALDPQLADGWYNLACLSQDRGDLDAAQRQFERAIACDPNYADALFNLAVLHLDRGNPAAALPLFERYIPLDPNSRWGRAARKAASLCRLYLGPGAAPG